VDQLDVSHTSAPLGVAAFENQRAQQQIRIARAQPVFDAEARLFLIRNK
jgi:hypothetical protein